MIFISNFAKQQSSNQQNRSVIANSEIDDQAWKIPGL
jgi:hypothetical protein